MALREKVLLVGFSGAGKSTLLDDLRMNYSADWNDLDDLDDLIFKKFKKNDNQLSELIQREGWDKFRLWERQLLEEWLKRPGRGVLALGGGALSPMVWELYKNSKRILFCHLQCSFEECWQRLLKSKELRPLMMEGKNEFKQIYDQRMRLFQQIEFTVTNSSNVEITKLAQKFREGYLSRTGGN